MHLTPLLYPLLSRIPNEIIIIIMIQLNACFFFSLAVALHSFNKTKFRLKFMLYKLCTPTKKQPTKKRATNTQKQIWISRRKTDYAFNPKQRCIQMNAHTHTPAFPVSDSLLKRLNFCTARECVCVCVYAIDRKWFFEVYGKIAILHVLKKQFQSGMSTGWPHTVWNGWMSRDARAHNI